MGILNQNHSMNEHYLHWSAGEASEWALNVLSMDQILKSEHNFNPGLSWRDYNQIYN